MTKKTIIGIGAAILIISNIGFYWAQGWIDEHPGANLAEGVAEIFGATEELSFQAQAAFFFDEYGLILAGAGALILVLGLLLKKS